jgi:hypothetical protein
MSRTIFTSQGIHSVFATWRRNERNSRVVFQLCYISLTRVCGNSIAATTRMLQRCLASSSPLNAEKTQAAPLLALTNASSVLLVRRQYALASDSRVAVRVMKTPEAAATTIRVVGTNVHYQTVYVKKGRQTLHSSCFTCPLPSCTNV